MIQLHFFPEDEVASLRMEVLKNKETTDKMRKALFARHGELNKKNMDIEQRLEILERYICQGKQC